MTKKEAKQFIDDLTQKGVVRIGKDKYGDNYRDANIIEMEKLGITFGAYYDAINILDAPSKSRKKKHSKPLPITDKDVEKYTAELKAIADEEGEGSQENISDSELIDPKAENVVIFLKKK